MDKSFKFVAFPRKELIYFTNEGEGERWREEENERRDGRRWGKGEIPFSVVIVAKMCVLCTVFVSFLFELISYPNDISTI